jgi:hypothetical protein
MIPLAAWPKKASPSSIEVIRVVSKTVVLLAMINKTGAMSITDR